MPALDGVLVEAQAGDAGALRRLYDELAPRVHGYLRVRGAAEPEDLTSEVFLAVLPRLGQVTGGVSGLRALLFSVAHARLVDDLRARSRRPQAAPYDPDSDGRASASAEVQVEVRLGEQRAHALLDRLPPAQREVLALRVLADLSLQQVAEALGRSEGSVKQLQRRGLLALRALVEQEGVTR